MDIIKSSTFVTKSHLVQPQPAQPQKFKKVLCVCKTISPILIICRIFGLIPITWTNYKGRCVFKRSIGWLIYSIFVCILFIVQLIRSNDLSNIGKNKPLPVILNSIKDTIYLIFVAVLTMLNIIRYPRFVDAFNHLNPLIKEGLLCQSALSCCGKLLSGILCMQLLQIIVQYGVLIGLHYSDSYETNFDYNIFINRGIYNIPFMFYMLFLCLCSLFTSLLACFEKLTISALKFTPVHPLKDIQETNNLHDFMSIVKYNICNETHLCTGKILQLKQAELIEYLRCLHEDISLIMYEINQCLNPQFLVHMIVELTVLIIHWYEVIIYIAYKFDSPMVSTLNFLNWMFVILHTTGIFLFLRNAQQIHNMVHGLSNILLEYSTRATSTEDQQQIRIFLEKLKQHRPFTASGVFTIDLGIAGPICANLLTYVLVALQFDIPRG